MSNRLLKRRPSMGRGAGVNRDSACGMLSFERLPLLDASIFVGFGMPGWQRYAKRVVDVIGAVAGLILFFPVMLVVAILIRADSEGPVLFRQTRVGRFGQPFTFYKFRTMRPNAEALKAELMKQNEADGPVFKIKNDPRVTKIGRLLRKTSLDELPQLWNVLRGEMSLVGPRPPIPSEVAQYTPYQRQRLNVVPGITCIWQTSGRSGVNFDTWVEMDLDYISQQSLWLDIRILVRTLAVVVRCIGAY